MPSISALSSRILVQSPTLIGLDLPLTTLIDIIGKRKQLLTSTQETIRANLLAISKAKGLISLVAPINYY
jgi:hypothetical protein